VLFDQCVYITSVKELPASIVSACFQACTRLRRRPVDGACKYSRDESCPGMDVTHLYASGVFDVLRGQSRIGDAVARRIMQFATAGVDVPHVVRTRIQVLEFLRDANTIVATV
jgi:hypothetical protein